MSVFYFFSLPPPLPLVLWTMLVLFGTLAEGAEENIWASEGRGDREVEENYVMRRLMICTAHPILFG